MSASRCAESRPFLAVTGLLSASMPLHTEEQVVGESLLLVSVAVL